MKIILSQQDVVNILNKKYKFFYLVLCLKIQTIENTKKNKLKDIATKIHTKNVIFGKKTPQNAKIADITNPSKRQAFRDISKMKTTLNLLLLFKIHLRVKIHIRLLQLFNCGCIYYTLHIVYACYKTSRRSN